MFPRLGKFVSRHWLLTIAAWVAIVAVLSVTAPRWDDIAHDGDLAYLPATMPSVQGERLMAEAFPANRAKSQVVIIVSRDDGKLGSDDIFVAYDLARRFQNLAGAARISKARTLLEAAAKASESSGEGAGEGAVARSVEAQTYRDRAQLALAAADEALGDAAYFDDELAEYWDQLDSDDSVSSPVGPRPDRLAAVYYNRAQLFEMLGKTEDAGLERERAELLDPALKNRPDLVIPQDAGDLPLLDVWTWRDRLVGEKLISADQGARLIVLQLSNEFMATDNIRVLNRVEQEVREVRESLGERMPAGLELGISGSAAVGGDILRSAAESIKNTELFTVLLVVLILILIYRSPLLIAVPLISIGLSLFVSTSVVALLTQLDQVPGFHWWELKIFTTTKIFVVVILFGAGTDYCLFLISRYREELEHEPQPAQAIVRALGGVGDALAASALTTILGLATMYFADFGKFRYSGPIIGLCLAITLLVCVTLTPALLCAFGRNIFWPSALARPGAVARNSTGHRAVTRVWSLLADWIVERPGLILVTSLIILMPAALHGFLHFTPLPTIVGESRVSYDFLNSLANDRPSKRGSALLRRHFSVGETGPLVVLAHKDGLSFESQQGADSLRQMADTLYVPGVRAVRCLADPLGDYRPGQKPGVLSVRARRLRMLRAHARTKDVFVTQVPDLHHSVTRLELILEDDPFSPAAIETLRHVDQRLHELSGDPRSVWHRARFAYTGTTAGIRDLRVVTQSDNLRIEVLVVLAVLAVLLVILRRPLICLYMIGSVLLSFYVTIGLTEFVFRMAYGSQFDGLDWKVPLFLFVILVAVGQDYNVYLATRVFEEQRRLGPREGLRRAVVKTGGIITSCGLIMSGTFLSMTSGVWLRWFGAHFPELAWLIPSSAGGLRSIAEMGFALALGVLLDTFVVRTILVPAFFSLLCRGPRRATDGRED